MASEWLCRRTTGFDMFSKRGTQDDRDVSAMLHEGFVK